MKSNLEGHHWTRGSARRLGAKVPADLASDSRCSCCAALLVSGRCPFCEAPSELVAPTHTCLRQAASATEFAPVAPDHETELRGRAG